MVQKPLHNFYIMGRIFKCCLYNCNKDTNKKTVLGLNGYTQKNRSQYIGLNSLIIKWRQPISLPSISLFQIVSLLVFFFLTKKPQHSASPSSTMDTANSSPQQPARTLCFASTLFSPCALFTLLWHRYVRDPSSHPFIFIVVLFFFCLGLKKKLLCRLAYSLHSFSASYSNISFALRLKTLLSLHHFPLVLVYWFSLQNPPSCTRYE